MFWARIEGLKAEYYICMGFTFTDKYEFLAKCFYWATSNDFKFKPLPPLVGSTTARSTLLLNS